MIDRYRNYRPAHLTSANRPRRGSFKLLLLAILLLSTSTFYASHILDNKQNPDQNLAQKQVVQAEAIDEPVAVVEVDKITDTTWQVLSDSITQQINAHANYDISVSIIDIQTGTQKNFGTQTNFAGASTTKVLTAAALLSQVEQGKLALNAENTSLIQKMINRSDNTAWDILNKKIGYSRLNSYAKSIGATSFDVDGNVITAADMAVILKKLYAGELLTQEHTQLLLSYMQQTNNEAMIPTVTPKDATIWHKYGQFEDRMHDAAIIDYLDRPITIVVYTKGNGSTASNYAFRTQLVAQLADTAIQSFYAPLNTPTN